MLRLIAFFVITLIVQTKIFSQELRAQVVVDASQTGQPNSGIFDQLENAIRLFLNAQVFTDQKYLVQEKINCSFVFTIEDFSNNTFRGQLQILSTRPVYGTLYQSTLFNYRDDDIEFEYQIGDRLEFVENRYSSELLSLLSFYCYLILSYDADSFSRFGGNQYINRARYIQQLARSYNRPGWSPQGIKRNRYQLIEELSSREAQILRRSSYRYHRDGLDKMTENPKSSLVQIRDSIEKLVTYKEIRPRSLMLQLFFDAKSQEILDILSQQKAQEKASLKSLLNRLSPINRDLWSQF